MADQPPKPILRPQPSFDKTAERIMDQEVVRARQDATVRNHTVTSILATQESAQARQDATVRNLEQAIEEQALGIPSSPATPVTSASPEQDIPNEVAPPADSIDSKEPLFAPSPTAPAPSTPAEKPSVFDALSTRDAQRHKKTDQHLKRLLGKTKNKPSQAR